MGFPVLAPHVVDVVGGHRLEVELLGQPEQLRDQPDLLLDPMVVELHEIVLLAEDLDHLPHRILGLLLLPPEDELGDPALHAAGEPDKPLRELGQRLQVRPRAVVEAVDVSVRDHLGKVLVALVGLGQHPDMVRLVVLAPGLLIVLVVGHHVALAPDDGLDPALLRLLDEIDRPEQVAMVGQGHGRLPQLHRPIHQAVHPAAPVQQAEV